MARSIFCMILLSLLIVASAIDYQNGPKPDQVVDDQHKQEEFSPSEPEYFGEETEELEETEPRGEENYDHHINNYINNIAIQGLVLCKSGQKYTPLVGALARITCLAVDQNGYEEAPFSFVSHKTDEKGFFLVTLSLKELLGSDNKFKLKECKAFLQESPLETSCNVPTDVNNGVSGAFLSSFRFLPQKVMALYTVKPFIFTSEPNYSVPEGHY